MQLELKHIKGGQLEQDYSCEAGDFPGLVKSAEAGDSSYRSPIHLHVRFVQSGRMIEVAGQIQATLDLVCGCCLDTFEYKVVEDVALTFVPEVEKTDLAPEQELDPGELGLISYRDDRLELLIPVQEQLLMAVPMHPICAAGCRGLCPGCGTDLNTTVCNCEKKVFNDKFGVLAQLRGTDDEKRPLT